MKSKICVLVGCRPVKFSHKSLCLHVSSCFAFCLRRTEAKPFEPGHMNKETPDVTDVMLCVFSKRKTPFHTKFKETQFTYDIRPQVNQRTVAIGCSSVIFLHWRSQCLAKFLFLAKNLLFLLSGWNTGRLHDCFLSRSHYENISDCAINCFLLFSGCAVTSQKTFSFTEKKSSFENADNACGTSLGAKFARIESDNELVTVANMMNESHLDYLWIALMKRQQFTFKGTSSDKCQKINDFEELANKLRWFVGEEKVSLSAKHLETDINDCTGMCLLLHFTKSLILLDFDCNSNYQVLCESKIRFLFICA